MMVTVIARESFNYAGIDRARGASFEATPEDAHVLQLIGKVDPPTRIAEERSAEPDATTDDDATEAPRRRYRRKDVIAE